MKPISPDEVQVEFNKRNIPEKMIQAVNDAIISKWSSTSKSATVKQDLILQNYFALVGKENTPENRGKVFEANMLDVEDIFRKAGWEVRFDKPGYNETYDAYFVFKKVKNS